MSSDNKTDYVPMPCCGNCKNSEPRAGFREIRTCYHPNGLFSQGMIVNELDCCDNFDLRNDRSAA